MVQTKFDIINNLLLGTYITPNEHYPWAFNVHVSIMDKLEKIIRNLLTNDEFEIYEQKLQIGNTCYEMYLIIILRESKIRHRFLDGLIEESQFSFPWEDHPTLFIEAASFSIIEKFIRKYKLEAHILRIEEKLGITENNEIIKVVSFNQNVNAKLNIIKEYRDYLSFTGNLRKRIYYFTTYAFPWQQSHWLRKVRINEGVYSTFHIILSHLGTLNYVNELNIIDLLSLRWALSDIHQPFQSEHVICEIDFMIKRKLVNIIKNNHLDIDSYLIVQNSKPRKCLINYLICEFQHFFQTVNKNFTFHCDNSEPYILYDCIKLAEESDSLNTVKNKFNINFDINGSNFDKMSLELFLNLAERRNVFTIILDTNYRWLRNISKLNRPLSVNKGEGIFVHLKGENTYNFIEDFIEELKTVTFINTGLFLSIYCSLNDYKIFDNLAVSEIKFENIKIDTNMLDSLHHWDLLNSLNKLRVSVFGLIQILIQEDEGTWQSLFEFVLSEMRKSNTNEFQLFTNRRKFVGVQCGDNHINLGTIKFTVDDQIPKLDLYDKRTNEYLDLYVLKCRVKPDDKSDYEFYE